MKSQADAVDTVLLTEKSEASPQQPSAPVPAVRVATMSSVHIGQNVFFVKTRSKFVFPQQLYTKGYDASNEFDEEVPEDVRFRNQPLILPHTV
jgi:hypothetical protein